MGRAGGVHYFVMPLPLTGRPLAAHGVNAECRTRKSVERTPELDELGLPVERQRLRSAGHTWKVSVKASKRCPESLVSD